MQISLFTHQVLLIMSYKQHMKQSKTKAKSIKDRGKINPCSASSGARIFLIQDSNYFIISPYRGTEKADNFHKNVPWLRIFFPLIHPPPLLISNSLPLKMTLFHMHFVQEYKHPNNTKLFLNLIKEYDCSLTSMSSHRH